MGTSSEHKWVSKYGNEVTIPEQCEWRDVSNGSRTFKASCEADAEWLIDSLNALETLQVLATTLKAIEKDSLQGSSVIVPKGLFNGP